MKVRKFVSLFLALGLAVSLVSCGDGGTASSQPDNADAEVTEGQNDEETAATTSEVEEERVIEGTSGINLRMTWLGSGQNKDLLDTCLQTYTEKTGHGVEVVFIPGTWAEYFTKIQTMVAGGETVDVCNVAIEGFEMLVDTGLAVPIDDWIAENQEKYDEVTNDISDNVMAFMNFGGQQYGVPNEWNNVVTHFNTVLLEEAGLELPAPDWTKEDFLSYAQALTKERDDGTMQYGCFVPNAYFMFEAWLYNNGTSLMTDDFTKSRLTEPEVVEMFQFMYDLIYEHKVAPIPETGLDQTQMLIDGNIAMMFAGRWPTNNYVTEDFTDVAVQYIPIFKTNVPIWGGQGVFTLKDSKHPDEATDLAVYLASAPFIEVFMQAGAIPVLDSVAQKVIPSLGVPDNSEIFFESAATAKAVQAPAQYAECANLIDRVFSDILINQVDIQSTLETADAELNMILMDNA